MMPVNKLFELKAILLCHGKSTISTGLVEYFSDSTLADGFGKYENWLNDLCSRDSHEKSLFKECVICSSNFMG